MGIKREAELLAPAGSMLSLKAAVNAGADAVYIGGQMFGARAYAQNPDCEEMIEAIRYAHIHHVKVYLTVNTLLKDRELEEQLFSYLLPFYEEGIDAAIVQDFGVFCFIRSHFPDLPIHASTQMNITGPEGAKFLEEAGAARIVTARELSLQEIKAIRERTTIEIESFVHGALCYCYSGQCLFSSILGGRSGNRGRCAQPCRLPYQVLSEGKVINAKNERYVLSPKDMCTIEILPEIIEAGVYSLKIEGRMKKPEYTAGVVSIYRKYLDRYLSGGKDGYRVSKQDMQNLFDIFNRNGFHESYYKTHNGRNMITLTESKFQPKNEKLINNIKEKYIDTEKKEKIKGKFIISKDFPVTLTVCAQDVSVQVSGEPAMKAQNAPAAREDIEKKLRKTGGTPFEFEELEISMEDDVFLPVSTINSLRRQCLNKLQNQICAGYQRKYNDKFPEPADVKDNGKKVNERRIKINVLVSSIEQLRTLTCTTVPELSVVYLDSSLIWKGRKYQTLPEIQQIRQDKVKVFLALPYIFRDEAKELFYPNMKQIENDFDGFLIRNMEEFAYFTEHSRKEMVTDQAMYHFNQRSEELLRENCDRIGMECLPVELNEKELLKMNLQDKELIAYGRIPVMITAGCLNKTLSRCNHKSDRLELEDRYRVRFPVDCICDYCYNIIYNSKPVSLLCCGDKIVNSGLSALRLEFTHESSEEMKQILDKFLQHYIEGKETEEIKEFTRGHFRRGVE